MNQLQAIAMNEGQRWKKKLFSESGRAQLEKFPLAAWALKMTKWESILYLSFSETRSNSIKCGQLPISGDCVFDASVVPETCRDRFVDLEGLTQQVSGDRITGKVPLAAKFPVTAVHSMGRCNTI
jgi:hypothetical protein